MKKTKLENIAKISIGALINRYTRRYEGTKENKEVLYHKREKTYTATEKIAKDINDKYLAQKDDIIFRLSEPQFATKIDNQNIKEGTVISSKFARIKPDKEKVNPDFLTELLNSKIIKNQFLKYSEGSKIKQIKIRDIAKIDLNIPPLELQEKYVESINLINQELTLYDKLINEKKDLKEGILQKSQGGEQ